MGQRGRWLRPIVADVWNTQGQGCADSIAEAETGLIERQSPERLPRAVTRRLNALPLHLDLQETLRFHQARLPRLVHDLDPSMDGVFGPLASD